MMILFYTLKGPPALFRCRPAPTNHNSGALTGTLLTYTESLHTSILLTKTAFHCETLFCVIPNSMAENFDIILCKCPHIIIRASTTLATVPASVASNAPVKVYLVLVTFAARK